MFSILWSGFRDEDGLVGRVFGLLGECWTCADELELYLLRRLAGRVWKAEDVSFIVGKVDFVGDKLMGAGLLKKLAGLDKRLGDLETRAGVLDCFVPFFPDAFGLSAGLVADAATKLAQLKEAILPVRLSD